MTLPSPLSLIAAGVVVVAGVTFVATGRDQPTDQAVDPVTARSSASAEAGGGGSTGDSADPSGEQDAAGRASGSASDRASDPGPSRTAKPQVLEKRVEKKPKRDVERPAVNRAQTYVEVYNNSGISGLAGSTAARAQGAGWQVVGSDNWYGTIPTSTVYYPPRLAAEATALGRDLGVRRTQPAIEPMRFDRLTVILTVDYAG